MNFEFTPTPRLLIGPGQSAQVPALARSLGSRPLIVHNGPPPTFVDGLPVRQRGEPKADDVDAAADLARREKCDVIIAVGGGSALDAAKAIAGLVTNGGVATDYMEVVGKGLKLTQPALPWIAVPTTAGTGAEVTRNAVVSSGTFKASIRSEHLLARAAVLDPTLAVPVPPEVTAASGMDALAQCIEAYVSKNANPLTDPLALQGVSLARQHLLRAVTHPDDLDARQGMSLAALLSGIALTNAGLGAVHGFAAPLGANFPIPHGIVCATLLPHVMRANLDLATQSDRPDLVARYHQLGGPEWVASLLSSLPIPRLSHYDLRPDHVPQMVSLARKSSSMRYNPVDLPDPTLSQILLAAL